MQSDVNGMQTIFRKEKAFVIMLLTGLALLNPASADDNTSKEWIDIGSPEESEKVSIKNIRKLGNKEFSYQNNDNDIILVKCDNEKILVRYWYVTNPESITPKQATTKMQWHRTSPKSQAQLESEFVCNDN